MRVCRFYESLFKKAAKSFAVSQRPSQKLCTNDCISEVESVAFSCAGSANDWCSGVK
jgi:hypothetical protein